MTDSLLVSTSADPAARGLDYLYGVRSLAQEPDLIDLVYDLQARAPICTWIGQHIDEVNAALRVYLTACHNCFHPWQQKPIQIWAAPLSQAFGIDGFCNLQTAPITILVDVGRVVPQDWLRLVLHEYAHASTGVPGHHQQFADVLSHLCLGLGIEPPHNHSSKQLQLHSYPYCRPTQDPRAFWRGETTNWAASTTDCYF